jgi:Ni/Fe-hydrogenase subunit HybB-like protein
VTNLNDRFPWGLWIGIDVLGGVAMAAGGFLIAGAVYILNMKKYKPIVRASILNAFFGYLLAATAISLDIGVPWRIWHPTSCGRHPTMWVGPYSGPLHNDARHRVQPDVLRKTRNGKGGRVHS